MDIIVGHDGMDLDSLGSIALALCLFPHCRGVQNRLCHPLATNVCNIYKDHLKLLTQKEIKGAIVNELIIVDTSSLQRIKETFYTLADQPTKITVIDHHQDPCTIPNAHHIRHNYGSNTTYFALQLAQQSISINTEMATIGLLGIIADTGNFSHDNVTPQDFQAAAYLLSQKADVSLAQHFLRLPNHHILEQYTEEAQKVLQKNLFPHHNVSIFHISVSKIPGLASIVDRINAVQSPDALFGVFSIKDEDQVVIIARSKAYNINVNHILSIHKGGGHTHAASATIKGVYNFDLLAFIEHIKQSLPKAFMSTHIMTSDFPTLSEDFTLYEASIYLENHHQTGAPVINKQGVLIGILSLRHISQARKKSAMQDTIKNHMVKQPIFCRVDTSLSTIEQIFFSQAIGRLPVLNEQNQIVGLITRELYLSFLQNHTFGKNIEAE